MSKSAPAATRFIERIAKDILAEQSDRDAFVSAFSDPVNKQTAIVWCGDGRGISPFAISKPAEWVPKFIDVLEPDQRPGKSELHDQGAFYVLDPTSAFEGSVLSALPGKSISNICDLCSAPGGKAVIAHQFFPEAFLLCNEVIGKRCPALISNLKRCRIKNSLVTSNDPKIIADNLPGQFDLVIVDAPCSGQSLLLKGEGERGAFHPVSVSRCASRQRRIVNCAASLLRPGGYLAYMTCTFAKDENEGIVNYFLKRYHDFESVRVPHLEPWRSKISEHHCYRIFPMDGMGAGGFCALLRRAGHEESYSQSDLVSKIQREFKVHFSYPERDG